jgi:hypothetical protein
MKPDLTFHLLKVMMIYTSNVLIVPECLQKAIFYLELKRDKYVYYTGGFLA